jgi:predicted nucleic acid-binding protein
MKVLFDTCIVIDLLRNRQSAVAWLAELGRQPHVSVVTIAELRSGQRGLNEPRAIDRFLSGSIGLDVSADVAEQAGAFMQRFRKSHALDLADALIAATAAHHGLALATLNLKHFPMFPHLEAPY